MANMQPNIRPAAVSGLFYHKDPAILQGEIDGFLNNYNHPEPLPENEVIRAIIAPHAGFAYSGQTAGTAYTGLQNYKHIRRVAIFSPSHREYFCGIALPEAEYFSTPLGNIKVDTQMCKKLATLSGVHVIPEAHTDEHAIEVHLPFIQSIFADDVTIVPMLVSNLTKDLCRTLAEELYEELWREDTLWIISSDFMHYGYSFNYVPFTEDLEENIKEYDRKAIKQILKIDPESFNEYINKTQITICGREAIRLLLTILNKHCNNIKATQLQYTTSGEMTGDFNHSVSYAAIRFTETKKIRNQMESLTNQDKIFLLNLARDTITQKLYGEGLPKVDTSTINPCLLQDGSCFVTLKINGHLRGCMGSLEAREPFYENVIDNAICAAFRDPRFNELTNSELDDIEIEISLLTHPLPVAGYEDIRIGTDGIVLRKQHHGAVFLPQVPIENNWDLATTLTYLSHKAGLAQNAWQHGCNFETFQAIVFSESELLNGE